MPEQAPPVQSPPSAIKTAASLSISLPFPANFSLRHPVKYETNPTGFPSGGTSLFEAPHFQPQTPPPLIEWWRFDREQPLFPFLPPNTKIPYCHFLVVALRVQDASDEIAAFAPQEGLVFLTLFSFHLISGLRLSHDRHFLPK